MKILKKFTYLLIFIICTNCGFKVLDKTLLNKFQIKEINSEGDKRINFLIKNNVSKLIDSKDPQELLEITIKSEKVKSIKEKNKKNKITKYTITIITNIEIEFLAKKKKKSFTISKAGYYDVTDNNNTNREALKRLEQNLSNEISETIAKKILELANDY